MAKKKWKKRLKKIAKAALIGGALYAGSKLLKGKAAKGAVSTAGQAVGVDRITPKTNWITKKVAPVAKAVKTVVPEGTDKFRPRVWPGTKLGERAALPGAGVKAPPGILNPYDPRVIRGRAQRRGGGIAKRGNGAAYKSGGRTGKQFGGGLNRPVAGPVGGVGAGVGAGVRAPIRPLGYKHGGKVKSMGVAKRGGGIAKR